jgi:hypothetical protein
MQNGMGYSLYILLKRSQNEMDIYIAWDEQVNKECLDSWELSFIDNHDHETQDYGSCIEWFETQSNK